MGMYPKGSCKSVETNKQVKREISGKFGAGNPGKPKGAISKTTKLAKEAIALAAEGLGGHERLIAWAQEDPLNERAFWTSIYPKLVPVQVSGEGGGAVQHSIRVTFG
jgi:hypothetical protein